MEKILIHTDYITLGQFLKLASLIQTGGECKLYLSEHVVLINSIEDNRRGRKLRNNDLVEVEGKKFIIVNESI